MNRYRLSPLPNDLAERFEERSAQVIARTMHEQSISLEEATTRFVDFLRAENPALYVAYGLRSLAGQEIATRIAAAIAAGPES
jgi:hypothetical protein